MLEYIQRLAWDPTAPVPAGWPHGWWGVLLLFCIPGGVGIPPGVLLGHGDGLGALFMTVLYFFSDVFLAAFFEPLLQVLALVSHHVPRLQRAGDLLIRAITATMPAGSLAGPTGVVLTGFGAGLPFGRAIETLRTVAREKQHARDARGPRLLVPRRQRREPRFLGIQRRRRRLESEDERAVTRRMLERAKERILDVHDRRERRPASPERRRVRVEPRAESRRAGIGLDLAGKRGPRRHGVLPCLLSRRCSTGVSR
jgi:hypothetical protein